MKNDINDISVEKLEKQIQYMYHDFKSLLNRSNSFKELLELRTQLKQAEESLRLRKRMHS